MLQIAHSHIGKLPSSTNWFDSICHPAGACLSMRFCFQTRRFLNILYQLSCHRDCRRTFTVQHVFHSNVQSNAHIFIGTLPLTASQPSTRMLLPDFTACINTLCCNVCPAPSQAQHFRKRLANKPSFITLAPTWLHTAFAYFLALFSVDKTIFSDSAYLLQVR